MLNKALFIRFKPTNTKPYNQMTVAEVMGHMRLLESLMSQIDVEIQSMTCRDQDDPFRNCGILPEDEQEYVERLFGIRDTTLCNLEKLRTIRNRANVDIKIELPTGEQITVNEALSRISRLEMQMTARKTYGMGDYRNINQRAFHGEFMHEKEELGYLKEGIRRVYETYGIAGYL